MSSIQSVLSQLSLDKYSESFISSGFNTIETLFSLSPPDLDKLLSVIGMLKGHTFKFKKVLEDAKSGILPQYEKAEIPEVLTQTSNLQSQLDFILALHKNIFNSLSEFVNTDLDSIAEPLMTLKSIQEAVAKKLNEVEVNI